LNRRLLDFRNAKSMADSVPLEPPGSKGGREGEIPSRHSTSNFWDEVLSKNTFVLQAQGLLISNIRHGGSEAILRVCSSRGICRLFPDSEELFSLR